MSPLEIWCNEAQERYVLTLAPQGLARFRAIAQRERCPYAVIGEITDDGLLLVHDAQFGNQPVHMPVDALLGQAAADAAGSAQPAARARTVRL